MNIQDRKSEALSKREYIAARMMQANRTRTSDYKSWHDMAKDAVEATDALLAELERTGGNDE